MLRVDSNLIRLSPNFPSPPNCFVTVNQQKQYFSLSNAQEILLLH
ncbi:hypothetical protein [Salirhabdus salicampi]|nr:hypothetical protein [Salirhabdus salicampi]